MASKELKEKHALALEHFKRHGGYESYKQLAEIIGVDHPQKASNVVKQLIKWWHIVEVWPKRIKIMSGMTPEELMERCADLEKENAKLKLQLNKFIDSMMNMVQDIGI